MIRSVPKEQYALWSSELAKAESKKDFRQVAILNLWLGEYELAVEEEPAKAAERFLKAKSSCKTEDPLYGWAVFNSGLALWYDSRWEDAALAFHYALRGHEARLSGFDRRTAALWLKQSKARLAEFKHLETLGLHRSASLDRHCGAASLAYCLRELKLPSEREQVLKAIRVTGRGSSSHDIMEAAKKLGASVHELVGTGNQTLKALPKPLIAYVERDHFVAVESADENGVVYRCNHEGEWLGGRYSVTWKQWNALTPGYFLCLAATGSADDAILTAALDHPEKYRNGVKVASGELGLGASSFSLAVAALFQGGGGVTRPRGDGNKRCGAPPKAPRRNPNAKPILDGDPVNLATGEEAYTCPPDLMVYNPAGPPVVWQRMYNSLRGYTPGDQYDDFGTGWSHTYNYYILDQDTTLPPLGDVWEGMSGFVIPTGDTLPADFSIDTDNDGVTDSSGPREWQVLQNGTTVAGSENWNYWFVGYQGSGLLYVAAPDGTAGLTYEVRVNVNGVGYSATFTMGERNLQPRIGGSRLLVVPNGASIPFSNSAASGSCSVEGGSDVHIHIDGVNGYTVKLADGTILGFSLIEEVYDWVFPTWQVTGLRYALTRVQDSMGQGLNFHYGGPRNYVPEKNWIRQLTSITNDGGDILLQIGRGGSVNLITMVSDIYGCEVHYETDFYPTHNPNFGFNTPHWELTSVSDVGNTQVRYQYGYTYVETGEMGVNSSGNPAPQANALLSNVFEPRSEGLVEVATINYENGTAFVSSVVDPYGNVHSYTEVDSSGVPTPMGTYLNTSITAPDSSPVNNFTVTHSSAQTPLAEIDGGGILSATMEYNSPVTPFHASAVTDAVGRRIEYTFDNFGNVLTKTTPKLTVTTYSYDYSQFPKGRLTSVQEGTKSPTHFEYFEPSGLVKKVISPSPTGDGTVEASFTYDALGNVLTATEPGEGVAARTVSYNYTEDGTYSQPARKGQPLVVTDGQGNTMRFRYDAMGRVTDSWDKAGLHSHTIYNCVGQVQTIYLPGGPNPDYIIYDYLYTGGPMTGVSLYRFDQGFLEYRRLRFVQYFYGRRNELLRVMGDASEHVEYRYDGLNRLSEVLDGRGNTLSYTSFNARGLVEFTGHPNTNDNDFVFRAFAYNDAGQVTVQQEYFYATGVGAGGTNKWVRMEFAYNDPDGLLSQIAYPQQSARNVDFQYDLYGRLSRVDDVTGFRLFTYNDVDMLETEKTRYRSRPGLPMLPLQTMRYRYNHDGSIRRLETPAGDFVYDYDTLGRLRNLTNPFNEVTRWNYQLNGWLKSQILANGVRSLYTFDEQGRLTKLVNRWTDVDNDPNLLLSRFTVPEGGYDAAGNRLAVQTLVKNFPAYSGMTQWTYDNQNRLINETSNRLGGWNASFVYDGSGNLTGFKGLARQYDKQNQLKSGVNLGAFSYDVQGNARKHAGRAIQFMADGRTTEFALAGVGNLSGTPALRCEYRSDGLRAWKENNFTAQPDGGSKGARLYFLYAGITPIIEMDELGQIKNVNTFGSNGLVSRRISTGNSSDSIFYTFDERGNTSQCVDASGQILTTSIFDAYGKSQSTVSTTDPYNGFGGQWGYYSDFETGLILCTYRSYDPALGRWISQDPIGYDGGLNLYSYVSNNPIVKFDPEGLDGLWYDKLQQWSSRGNEVFKSSVIDLFSENGNSGIAIATIANSAADLVNGFFSTPASIGHLGEGSGNYAGSPKCDPYALGVWSDVGTASGVLLSLIGGLPSGKVAISGPADRMVDISRWGRPGLQPGDWVMQGKPHFGNYLLTAKWQRGMGNQYSPFNAGQSFSVPANTLSWPKGIGIDGAWKGLFGQRIYKP